jgi:4-hydroxy-3-methylbut-2-enyl diphosphate reductase
MIVRLDPHAGPCNGVKRALKLAEDELAKDDLVALGPIIHNQAEMDRLQSKGLITADQESVEHGDVQSIKNKKVFIRSHGISKKLRQQLVDANVDICDGTCPIVLSIQRRIEKYYKAGYKIFIIGKAKHPEVMGLNGACDHQASIIQNETDLDNLNIPEKSFLVSQTTVNHNYFLDLQEKMLQIQPCLIVKDTVCSSVTNRHENTKKFAADVDVVLLVGGKKSSNTQVLFEIAKQSNPQSFWIERRDDINPDWFEKASTVGITGSASTPIWQMVDIQKFVEGINSN